MADTRRNTKYMKIGATLKKIIIGLLALTLLGGGAYLAFGRAPAPAPAMAAAEPVQASDQVVAEARVVPARSAALSLSTGGVVAEVAAREGDQVQAGQVIARLDDAQQQARVAAAET